MTKFTLNGLNPLATATYGNIFDFSNSATPITEVISGSYQKFIISNASGGNDLKSVMLAEFSILNTKGDLKFDRTAANANANIILGELSLDAKDPSTSQNEMKVLQDAYDKAQAAYQADKSAANASTLQAAKVALKTAKITIADSMNTINMGDVVFGPDAALILRGDAILQQTNFKLKQGAKELGNIQLEGTKLIIEPGNKISPAAGTNLSLRVNLGEALGAKEKRISGVYKRDNTFKLQLSGEGAVDYSAVAATSVVNIDDTLYGSKIDVQANNRAVSLTKSNTGINTINGATNIFAEGVYSDKEQIGELIALKAKQNIADGEQIEKNKAEIARLQIQMAAAEKNVASAVQAVKTLKTLKPQLDTSVKTLTAYQKSVTALATAAINPALLPKGYQVTKALKGNIDYMNSNVYSQNGMSTLPTAALDNQIADSDAIATKLFNDVAKGGAAVMADPLVAQYNTDITNQDLGQNPYVDGYYVGEDAAKIDIAPTQPIDASNSLAGQTAIGNRYITENNYKSLNIRNGVLAGGINDEKTGSSGIDAPLMAVTKSDDIELPDVGGQLAADQKAEILTHQVKYTDLNTDVLETTAATTAQARKMYSIIASNTKYLLTAGGGADIVNVVTNDINKVQTFVDFSPSVNTALPLANVQDILENARKEVYGGIEQATLLSGESFANPKNGISVETKVTQTNALKTMAKTILEKADKSFILGEGKIAKALAQSPNVNPEVSNKQITKLEAENARLAQQVAAGAQAIEELTAKAGTAKSDAIFVGSESYTISSNNPDQKITVMGYSAPGAQPFKEIELTDKNYKGFQLLQPNNITSEVLAVSDLDQSVFTASGITTANLFAGNNAAGIEATDIAFDNKVSFGGSQAADKNLFLTNNDIQAAINKYNDEVKSLEKQITEATSGSQSDPAKIAQIEQKIASEQTQIIELTKKIETDPTAQTQIDEINKSIIVLEASLKIDPAKQAEILKYENQKQVAQSAVASYSKLSKATQAAVANLRFHEGVNFVGAYNIKTAEGIEFGDGSGEDKYSTYKGDVTAETQNFTMTSSAVSIYNNNFTVNASGLADIKPAGGTLTLEVQAKSANPQESGGAYVFGRLSAKGKAFTFAKDTKLVIQTTSLEKMLPKTARENVVVANVDATNVPTIVLNEAAAADGLYKLSYNISTVLVDPKNNNSAKNIVLTQVAESKESAAARAALLSLAKQNKGDVNAAAIEKTYGTEDKNSTLQTALNKLDDGTSVQSSYGRLAKNTTDALATPDLANNYATSLQSDQAATNTANVAVLTDVAQGSANMIGWRADNVAAAAGDEDGKANTGIWANVFFNSGVGQKNADLTGGYNANGVSGVVGADHAFSDNVIMGAAIGFANSNIKAKEKPEENYSKINAILFSVYGHFDINKNIFSDVILSYGNNKITSNSYEALNAGKFEKVTTPSYNNNNIVAQAKFGYNVVLGGGINFRPQAGLQYLNIGALDYTRTGVDSKTPIKTKTDAQHNISGLIGGTISTDLPQGNMVFTPEAHVLAALSFGNKTSKIVNTYEDTILLTEGTLAAPKSNVNFGASLKAVRDNIEGSIGGDVLIGNKFTGYQGSLKVRVNL